MARRRRSDGLRVPGPGTYRQVHTVPKKGAGPDPETACGEADDKRQDREQVGVRLRAAGDILTHAPVPGAGDKRQRTPVRAEAVRRRLPKKSGGKYHVTYERTGGKHQKDTALGFHRDKLHGNAFGADTAGGLLRRGDIPAGEGADNSLCLCTVRSGALCHHVNGPGGGVLQVPVLRRDLQAHLAGVHLGPAHHHPALVPLPQMREVHGLQACDEQGGAG